jgi:protoporphyrinogen oxidase
MCLRPMPNLAEQRMLIMNDRPYSSVVVLGAGLSGIACARRLPGSRVFEAKSYIGGHSASHAFEGFHFDEGAHICHSKDEEFLDLIGVKTRADVVNVASKTASWDDGSWLPYPVQNHLHALPTKARIEALKDFVNAQIAQADASAPVDYESWCRSQYGRYLTENYYRRYTEKYWRMTMAEMDTDWFKGRLMPSQVDSVLAGAIASQVDRQPVFTQFRYAARGGFLALMQPLLHGVEVTLSEPAVRVDQKDKKVTFASGREELYETLVSTVPLPLLIGMMTDVPQSVLRATAQLKWTQLICINFVVARTNVVPWHWFYIYDSDIEASRVSVPSYLSLHKGKETLIQAEVFRRYDESFDLDNLKEKVVSELCPVLGITRTEICAVEARHVPFGYVIPCLGHAAASEEIITWLKLQSIETAGLFGRWKYLWSDEAYRSGEQAAHSVKTTYSTYS